MRRKPELLAKELGKCPAGRNVIDIDRGEDILTAAQIDRFDVVPELELASFRIRCANSS